MDVYKDIIIISESCLSLTYINLYNIRIMFRNKKRKKRKDDSNIIIMLNIRIMLEKKDDSYTVMSCMFRIMLFTCLISAQNHASFLFSLF